MSDPPPAPPSGSRFALVVLLALVVLSPWPFGSAHPLTRWLISMIGLLTSLGIALVRLWRREGIEVPLPAVFAAGMFIFGFVQLVPLPPGIHAVVAPGSAAIWHPAFPAAAEVLGHGPRPVSIWPEATRRAIGIGIGLIGLAVLAMPALRGRRWAVRSASVVVASGVAVAVYGLVARSALGDKLYGVFAVPTVAPFGPFVSKNHFAGYVEMTALLALGLASGVAEEARRSAGFLGWAESRRAPRVVLAYGAFALLSLAVLVSLSRGGAVSLASGVVAFLLLRPARHQQTSARWRRRGLGAIAGLAVTIAVLAVLPPEARDRLKTIGAGSRDMSTAFRATVWRDSLKTVEASPLLGHGLGTFVDALPRFKTGAGDVLVEHAENDYLELCTEAGGAGFAILLGCIVTLFRAAVGHSVAQGHHLRNGVAAGAAAGLLALAAHSLVDFNLRIPSNACLAAVLATCVLLSSSAVRGERAAPLALAAICAAALWLVSSPPRPGGAGWPHRPGAPLPSTPLRMSAAADALARGLNERPADAPGWARLGWARTSLGQRAEGTALARYGAHLDPKRTALQELARQLGP